MVRFRVDTADNPTTVEGWATIGPAPGGLGPDPTKDVRAAAERAVAEILQSDHLIVLCGLGTSLCIKNPANSAESIFPTMDKLWATVARVIGEVAFTEVRQAVSYVEGNNIENLLSRCLMKLSLGPDRRGEPSVAVDENKPNRPDIAEFVRKAEAVIRTECDKSLDDPTTTEVHEDFLRRLVRRGARRPRANLFTTNYDLCFETAAARISLPVIDGFSFSVPPRFEPEAFDYDIVTNSSYSKEPDFVPRLLRLFKLHGSIDWHQEAGFISKRRTDRPLLIYPQSGKYAASYSPPFLEVMSRFQGLLRQRNVGILSICCGFNDLHVAEPLLSAVKSNSSLRMVVCAPDLCDTDARNLGLTCRASGPGILENVNHLIENGDTRLTLINAFFPALVALMPVMPTQTDVEQHEARIKKLEVDMAKLKASRSRQE